MPAHTNRGIAFAGVNLRLQKRAYNAATCKVAILDALRRLPSIDDDVTTVDQIHDLLALEGIEYPRNTVYKTMLRMSNAEDSLVRVAGGFRTMAPI